MKMNRFFCDVADDRPQKFGWSANYYAWSVLGRKIPLSLQISPDDYAQITNAYRSTETQRDDLQSSEWAGGSPTPTIGFFLVLLGFLGTAAGLFGFLVCTFGASGVGVRLGPVSELLLFLPSFSI
jgi:hypothetical protein